MCDEGSGEVVVAVHGNPTWSFYYRELIEAGRLRFWRPTTWGAGCGTDPMTMPISSPRAPGRRFREPLWITWTSTSATSSSSARLAAPRPATREGQAARDTQHGAFHLPHIEALPWQLRLIRDAPLRERPGPRSPSGFTGAATRFGVTRRPMGERGAQHLLLPMTPRKTTARCLRFVEDAGGTASRHQITGNTFTDKPILICWGDQDFVLDHHFLAEDGWGGEARRFADGEHIHVEDYRRRDRADHQGTRNPHRHGLAPFFLPFSFSLSQRSSRGRGGRRKMTEKGWLARHRDSIARTMGEQ